MIPSSLHTRLSKAISHALRHEPAKYGLTLGSGGWVSICDMVAGLRRQDPAFKCLEEKDIIILLDITQKVRHEVQDGMIRALYGHSTPDRVSRPSQIPPAVLFHGTAPDAWDQIRREGLRPMGRQYVHLSMDIETASCVGKRKAETPVLLTVDSQAAHASGCEFFKAGELTWLARSIPAEFIRLLA